MLRVQLSICCPPRIGCFASYQPAQEVSEVSMTPSLSLTCSIILSPFLLTPFILSVSLSLSSFLPHTLLNQKLSVQSVSFPVMLSSHKIKEDLFLNSWIFPF